MGNKFIKEGYDKSLFANKGRKQISDSSNFDTFNIMGMLLTELAFDMEEINQQLVRALNNSHNGYIKAQNKLKVFFKQTSAYFRFTEKEKIIITLKLEVAEAFKKLNKFDEGADLLVDVFKQIIEILKRENVIFPRKKKSYTFRDYMENEIS